MIDKNDKYNSLLGDKLSGLREEPPAGMFDRIEQTLVAQGVVAEGVHSEPAGVVVPLWRRPLVRGVVATLAAAMVALAVLVNVREVAPQIVVEVAQMPTMASPEVGVAMPDVKTLARVERTVSAPVQSVLVEQQSVEIAPKMSTESPESEQRVMTSSTKGEKTRTHRTRTRRRSENRRSNAELEDFWRGVLAEQNTQRVSKMPTEIGLYAANVGFNRGHIEAENMASSSMVVQEKNQHTTSGKYLTPSFAAPRETKTHLEHYMPITVGVTLSYSLGDWLSFDSGLLYTNLYSKSESTGVVSDYGVRRTMDYLGVPLALSASITNVGNLSLYGRLGGTAELCINAVDKTFLDGEMLKKSDLDVPLLSYSLDAALGATYQIFGGVGLFGEVGCSYWITSEDYPENYRTVHPLSLSSRFGLRFTFN
ncbi:MAG: hypothetical protein J6U53_05580 [Tidjanibacter sp.]|nr:hypothetical protein [Tidjanibacter sp.]